MAGAAGAVASMILAIGSPTVVAQSAAPMQTPVFIPGLYETESRVSTSQTKGERSTLCIAAADYDAFRRETIARFLELPQFHSVCRLRGDRPIADGFVLAMDCDTAKTIITYSFAKNLVTSTSETKVAARPEYASTILTLWRRIGPCPGPSNARP